MDADSGSNSPGLTAQVIANAAPPPKCRSISCTCRWSICGPNRWWCATRLIAALESKGDQSISFSELTRDCTSRIEVVARFMAVLVFFKQGVLQYQQDGPFAELHLRWVPGVAETMSDVNISEGDFA